MPAEGIKLESPMAHFAAKTGALLQVGLLIGALGLVTRLEALSRSLKTYDARDSSLIMHDLQHVVAGMHIAATQFFWWLCVAGVGLLFFAWAVIRGGYRRKWALRFGGVYCPIAGILTAPIGSIPYLAIAIYLWRHRREFDDSQRAALTPQSA